MIMTSFNSKNPIRHRALFCAVILACALSSGPTYAGCGFGGCPADAAITADVQASFGQYSVLKAPNLLHVQTLNGVVYLSGTVSAGLQSEIAESVARHVNGVTRVVNSIGISH
jgi:osmotically-inducible protein OsmY